jgi:CBS domain containing-hemolysin-like protein
MVIGFTIVIVIIILILIFINCLLSITDMATSIATRLYICMLNKELGSHGDWYH